MKHITKKCKCCNTEIKVRMADHKRGWGVFCSKSCKAKYQTKVTGISGPHYKASGKSVNDMKNGNYAKSKINRMSFDEYDERKKCFCGEVATVFVRNGFGHDGAEGFCEDHVDDTHPFDIDQW